MSEPIEEVYFNWLYGKVVEKQPVHTPSNTYLTMLRDLHTTEFIWIVSGDDNRAADGLDIRRDFLIQAQLEQDPAWNDIPCSVLEMFIAFSRRASFETELSTREWLWIFLRNLGLADLTDATLGVTQTVYEVMDTFIWRTYRRNGEGGLFPLTNPEKDQRTVEIYYQFCEWLVENDIF